MDLAIVILNWNAAGDTICCVRKILAWRRLDAEVIVVDNASIDNSVETIRRECPGIHLICNPVNEGFSGGTNRGIRHALSLGNAPILLLNNDAMIEEDEVAKLLRAIGEQENLGFIGPLLYDAERTDQLISAGGKNPVKHHQTRIRTIRPGRPIQRVAYVSGTAILIRADIFRTVGELDEDYFFSTELADLCMRARQYGYESAIHTQARAFHSVSRSATLRDTLYVYYIIRNRFIFIRNSPYKLKFLFYGFWTLYSAILSVKLHLTGQPATARAVGLGLSDALHQRFGGQNERVLAHCDHRRDPVKAS